MTNSATPAASPVPIIPLGHIPAMFANQIMVAADQHTILLTFSQFSPVTPTTGVAGETYPNLPIVAMQVAKVVMLRQALPELIQNLKNMSDQLEANHK